MSLPLPRRLVPPAPSPEPPDHPLQLGRGAPPGQIQQIALVRLRGHPGQGPDLGERQLAPGHGGAGLGKALQCPCGPHLLPGRTQVDPGAGVEPVSAGAVATQLPTPPAVEVTDEGQEPVGGGVDVSRQRGDLLLQLLQSVRVVEGLGERVAEEPVVRVIEGVGDRVAEEPVIRVIKGVGVRGVRERDFLAHRVVRSRRRWGTGLGSEADHSEDLLLIGYRRDTER